MNARLGILKNNEFTSVYLYQYKDIKSLCTLLKDYYKKESDILELFKMGDIFYLSKDLNTSNFYSRDQKDPFEACMPIMEKEDSLEKINTSSSPVDYYLVFTNKWNICESYNSNWTSVVKFLNKLNKKK